MKIATIVSLILTGVGTTVIATSAPASAKVTTPPAVITCTKK